MLKTYSWFNTKENIAAILSMIFWLLFVLFSSMSSTIPKKMNLTSFTGSLNNIHKTYGKGGINTIHFCLTTDSRCFKYSNQQKGLEIVFQQLNEASGLPIQILYDSECPASNSCSAYEIKINGRMVRSYEQYFTAKRFDSAIGMIGGFIFFLLSIGLYFRKPAIRRQPD